MRVGLAAIFVLALDSIAFSAPSISSITGDVVQGATLTINATNAGTKSPVAPYLWAPMEGSTVPSTLGRSTTYYEIIRMFYNNGTTVYSGVGAIQSSANWKTFLADVGFSVNEATYSTKYYLNWDKMVTYPYEDVNMKWLRGWKNGTTYPDVYWGTQGPAADSRLLTIEYTASNPTNYFVNKIPHPSQSSMTWLSNEFLYQNNSANDVVDGHMELRVATCSSSFSGIKTDTAGTFGYVGEWYFEDDPSNAVPSSGDVYYDNLYLDTSWSRVIISTHSTLTASYQRDMQIPIVWSDSQVQVSVNTGRNTNGQIVYLYLCDNNNSCSNGYQLTIGNSYAQPQTTHSLSGPLEIKGVTIR